MARPKKGSIFISYRRDDAGPEARAVRDAVDLAFGKGTGFFDTATYLGAKWPDEIRKGLDRAHTVLAVIGGKWIGADDKWGRRRIDDPADWVRQELIAALASRKRVIPLLVGDASVPPAEALPMPLAGLPQRQAIQLRRDFWDHDIRLLIVQLHEMDAATQRGAGEAVDPYPQMTSVKPTPLPDAKIRAVLAAQLTEWRYLKSPLPEDPKSHRMELFREYRFPSFQAAIRFMREVSVGCDIADHHPRWENIYDVLRVYLTTWGIRHRVTDRDVQLARYFDDVFKRPTDSGGS